jgi:hypothetical protein
LAAPANPFTPAAATVPKVKALLYGPPGKGKTWFGLASPGPVAVIDTEGGTAFYAKREGLSEFDRLSTKSYADIIRALDFLATGDTKYQTLVIDPVTIVYDQLQDAALKVRTRKAGAKAARSQQAFDADDVDLEMLDWGRIKRSYKALMRRITNLPMHVIVTAREKDVTERRNGEMVKVGTRPDAEKGTAYEFDVVLRLDSKGTTRIATVEKDRTGTLALGDTIVEPSFESLFGAFAATKVKGAVDRVTPDDEAAAEQDAALLSSQQATQDRAIAAKARRQSSGTSRTSKSASSTATPASDGQPVVLATPEQATELASLLSIAGVDPDELRAKRGLPPFAQMPADKVEALIGWAKSRIPGEAQDEAPAPSDAEAVAA